MAKGEGAKGWPPATTRWSTRSCSLRCSPSSTSRNLRWRPPSTAIACRGSVSMLPCACSRPVPLRQAPDAPAARSPAALLFSKAYAAAMVLAGGEHVLENRYVPWIKCGWATACGVAVAAAGEAVRKAGVLTARRNFTHRVQFQRREGHVLVTHGIYRCDSMHACIPRRCQGAAAPLVSWPCACLQHCCHSVLASAAQSVSAAAGCGTRATWGG